MKLFIDTANVDEIREMAWILDGVTTNPSLVARERRPLEEIIAEICAIVDGPVSAEATALDADAMVEEAHRLSRIHENVVVKIPMTEPGLRAAKHLAADGIRTNVTLVFSAAQALLAAKSGATFVSPFVGRIDDIGGDGMAVVAEIIEIYNQYGVPTEVIVASVRHPRHVLDSALLGAGIATVPYAILKRMFDHPLTDAGIERFLRDWEGVPK